MAPCSPVASLLVHLTHSLSAKCPPHYQPASQPAHLLLLLVNIAHQLPIHLVNLALNSSVLTLCQLILPFLSTLHNCCTHSLPKQTPRNNFQKVMDVSEESYLLALVSALNLTHLVGTNSTSSDLAVILEEVPAKEKFCF